MIEEGMGVGVRMGFLIQILTGPVETRRVNFTHGATGMFFSLLFANQKKLDCINVAK